MISGVTPNSCAPKADPVRPQPVMTSSKINNILCLSQISLSLFRYPFGGTKIPVDPAIGSTIQAAISPGNLFAISYKSFASSAPVSGWPLTNLFSGKNV